MISRAVVAFSGVLMLSGCILFIPASPTDLVLESVEIVDATSAWSSENRLIRLGDRMAMLPPRHGPFPEIKIEFSTRADLVMIERGEHFIITNKIWFCDEEPDKYGVGIGNQVYTFWAGGALKQFVPNSEVAELYLEYERQERKRFTVYIDVIRTDTYNASPGALPLPHYDLSREPRDLCLRMAGWQIFHGAFHSNVIKIPKEVITRAFANPHL